MILVATDFGLSGSYTGEIMAVFARGAPEIPAIMLIADFPPFAPKLAAYHLAALFERTEPGDVLVGVVDPGVGSDRLPLAIEADGRWLVGPDNGLFEPVMRRARSFACHAIEWRPERPSASFHGRDLFAPVAIRLARGDRPALRPVRPMDCGDWPDDLAAVVHVDRYGNLITGLRASFMAAGAVIDMAGQSVARCRTFSDRAKGGLFYYENSAGLIEIAATCASAASITGLSVGDSITLELQEPPQDPI
ncbi:MAG: SAM-dependent chlorinase/fluorinase [Geminicoccaceae bacterium]|nr:SAM-dependent chlorinase/fluorinase [Geminicoccaceae bacterium]